jgi:Tfp pilus assembly protein PilP
MIHLARWLPAAACSLALGAACGEQAPRTVAQELAPRLELEPPVPAGDADLASAPFSLPPPAEPQSPLERIPLAELRLAGVVLSDSPTALVEDVSGRGHLVRVGTAIGTAGGRVLAISDQELVVEERHLGDDGRMQRRTRTLRMDARAG